MMNFILAPLGILLMLLGAVGLFVAVRGPERLNFRRSDRAPAESDPSDDPAG